MATLLLQAAGAFLGGFLGPVGTAIGSAVGATAGYLVDRALIDGTRHYEGARLAGARPFTAEEGASIPRVYGAVRIGGTLIWATRFEETKQAARQGSKGGPSVTTYAYFANAAFLLCEGPIAGLRRIWADGKELDRTLFDIRVYPGSEDQLPDPLIEAKQGSGNAPAYRGAAYVVFERFPLGDYGNRIPQFQFEVLKPEGDLAGRIRAMALIPGSTEYGLSPSLVTYSAHPGDKKAVNRHMLTAATDLAASLDELQALCPALEHVALVVTWFGDDLRAGHCRIRPAVTQSDPGGFSQAWQVSGIARPAAMVVSRFGGAAAYGGTPSDRSVTEAIAEIRARGLKVTLYPLLMMDIAAGNALPDPYGGAEQAAYPWRGRITCMPAAGRPGTADKTAAARSDIAAFCGSAAPGDFLAADGTVAFSGAPDDWGYRRFVLHYAALAAAAGGVDAFLIGSELRGLTTLRDETGAFPFVGELCTLAADVRAVLGAGTAITYGADWSEYFGHQPADGTGDVFFHLDPLWAHEAIDAVGIDNYMPLSDWRDADHAGGNPDGFAGPYDPEGLAAGIAGGEGYDWYYADWTARSLRQRTPITDGAYGKPWVFRYKDLVGWWSNPHHDRPGGVESGTPTAWVPRSKPIWFTELGCAAVDKGPNQPNVFPDPKSSEDARPWFSNGGRSDLAQHRFLSAHLEHWDPAGAGFDPAANPVSPVYGGHMVDASRLYLWAWDARPFPAFPLDRDLWGDGGNWSLGHWLNGRLTSVTLGDLANAILRDHGLPAAETANADGTVAGYVVADPSSARAAIEPLADLFGLAAREDAGTLVLASEGAQPSVSAVLDDLVFTEDAPLIERTRDPAHALPTSAELAFQDPFLDYQSASARAVRSVAGGERERTLGLSGAIETGEGQALVSGWLRRAWAGRDRIAFQLRAAEAEPMPGAIVRLQALSGAADYLVTDVEEGLTRRISARRIERVAPFPWRTELPQPASPALSVAGAPLVHFLDLPMVTASAAPESRFRAAVWARPWKSELLYASPEDTGFELRTGASMPAVVGELGAALAGGFSGRVDAGGSLTVLLYGGELQSVSPLRMLNGANAAAVRAANGVWEILQFADAEEVAPSTWRISRLLRGQLGTEDAMAAGAPAGAPFVLIDDAVIAAGLKPAEIGLPLNWRVGPSGYDFAGPAFGLYSETGGLRALTPLSPAHLRAERLAGGDIAVSWIRRGRVDADSWLGADIPLGEESEAYQVDVAGPGGGTVRGATVSEASWLYPAAARAADFPVPPAAIVVTVRQVSAAVGPGLPASATVALG